MAFGVFFAGLAFAAITLPEEVNEDLFFNSDGALMPGVELPSDLSSETGSSSAKLGGTGSVTLSDQRNGGFPQMTILGGTTVKSTREWGDANDKSWWEGQLSTPGSGRLPQPSEVEFAVSGNHESSSIEVLDAYNWGLANETFSYSPEARMYFEVSGSEGQRIWIALKEDEMQWEIDEDDFCVIRNGLCYFEVSEVNSLALVREDYMVCPRETIANGSVSGAPSCLITCDSGYTINEEFTACVQISTDSESGMEDGAEMSESDFAESVPVAPSAADLEIREGYFRYLGTRDQVHRQLSTENLTGEALEDVQRKNLSYFTRNPQSALEKAEEKAERSIDSGSAKDSFLNYLLQMRNAYGNRDRAMPAGDSMQANSFEAEIEPEEAGEIGATFSGSAPMLPSTGPGVFAGLAALGLGMMIFGIRRRQ